MGSNQEEAGLRKRLEALEQERELCEEKKIGLFRAVNKLKQELRDSLIGEQRFSEELAKLPKSPAQIITDCNEEIKSIEAEAGAVRKQLGRLAEKKRKERISAAVVIALVVLLSVSALFLTSKLTGFVTREEVSVYTQQIGANFTQPQQYLLNISAANVAGELRSLELSGRLIGNGAVKVYLQSGNARLLVLDRTVLQEKGMQSFVSITGMVVADLTGEAAVLEENITAAVNESEANITPQLPEELSLVLNETQVNETQANETAVNETAVNETQPAPEPPLPETPAAAEKAINISLAYKPGTVFDADDDGVELDTGAIDFTVEGTNFSWPADWQKLCTRWVTTSLDNNTQGAVCYGNTDCCALVELSPEQPNWNDAFELFVGRYGATHNNTVSSQVIFANYSLGPENVYSEIYYSSFSTLPATFITVPLPEENLTETQTNMTVIEFSNICVETCSLAGIAGLNLSEYTLFVEVENATLVLDSATYALAKVVEIDTEAPVVAILLPRNITYTDTLSANDSRATTPLKLNFTVSEPTAWIGYSLNGRDNVTISSNTTIAADNGTNTLMLYATDAAGNVGYAVAQFFVNITTAQAIDAEPPIITALSPLPNATYNATAVELNFTVSEPASFSYFMNLQNRTEITSNITLAASEGRNRLLLLATDAAGNVGSESVIFFVNASSTTAASLTINITPLLRARKPHFKLGEDAELEFEYIKKSELVRVGKWKDGYEAYEDEDDYEEFLENVSAAKKAAVEQVAATEMIKAKRKQLRQWVTENETITAAVAIPEYGVQPVDIEIEELREGKFRLQVHKPRAFRPGLYKATVEFVMGNESYSLTQDFTWGVLAINTNKSIFVPNEDAFIAMAVLNDKGEMVCDADVTLAITDPAGAATTLTTAAGQIAISPECQVYGITNMPDYYTNYTVIGVGTYVMNLTAATANGIRTITDSFTVQSSVDFDVARAGPTRIYPPVPYVMNIIITASSNYNGQVIEYVPASFTITPQQGLTVTAVADAKVLSWDVNLKKDETTSLSYVFDAPDVSPYLYTVGRLRIGTFTEARDWMVASDVLAAGEVEAERLTTKECFAMVASATTDTFTSACDGTYPAGCGASADLVSCNDAQSEVHNRAKDKYAGVNITAFNDTITNCDTISSVRICVQQWAAGTIGSCLLSVDDARGASWSTASTTCPGSTEPVPITCVDASALETWTCSDFFGASTTKANAKTEHQRTSAGGASAHTIDVLYFNVTYTEDTTAPNVTIIAPSRLDLNNTNVSGSFLINASINDTNGAARANLTIYNNTANATGLIPMTLGAGTTTSGYWNVTFDSTTLRDDKYNLSVNGSDAEGNWVWSANVSVTIDNTKANTTLVSPANLTNFTDADILINASVNDTLSKVFNVTFQLQNSAGNATEWLYATLDSGTTGQGYWNATVSSSTLVNGYYNITVNATDYAGNQLIENLSSINVSAAAATPRTNATNLTETLIYEEQCSGEGCDALYYSSAVTYNNGTEITTINTSIAESGDAIYDYEITKNVFNLFFKSTPATAASVKIVARDSDGYDRFSTYQPHSLNYRNALNQIDQISTTQNVAADISNDTLTYPNIFGAGINLSYTAFTTQLKEQLTIKDKASLPSPAAFITAQANVTLDVDFVIGLETPQEYQLDIYVDNALWDRSSKKTTQQQVDFRDSSNFTIFYLPAAVATDANGEERTLTYELKKQGNALYVILKTNYSWLNETGRAYPVSIDPTTKNPNVKTAARIAKAGVYNMSFSISNYGIKNVTIRNANISERSTKLFEVQSQISSRSMKLYALRLFEGENATITVNATATWLNRCDSWNFTSKSCDGYWTNVSKLFPGQDYTINHTGEAAYSETGLIAINTQKSIYLENELANISIGILDEIGRTICDANVTLLITDPNSLVTNLTTEAGNITRSAECSADSVTYTPDYAANYTVSSPGTYWMNATATFFGVNNTVISPKVNSTFEVRASVDFDVARTSATRIYPSAAYFMNFTIKANSNFNGNVTETVPASFAITPSPDFTVENNSNITLIKWNVSFAAGSTYNLSYEFDAPDVSPEFYLLGELEIGAFREARQWQVASDAPALWTDSGLSCTPDPVDAGSSLTCSITYTCNTNTCVKGPAGFYLQDGAARIDDTACADIDFQCNGVAISGTCADPAENDATCRAGYGATGCAQNSNLVVTYSFTACSGASGANTITPVKEDDGGASDAATLDESYVEDISTPPDTTPPNNSIIVPLQNSNFSGNFVINASVNDSQSDVFQVNLTVYNNTGNATGLVQMNISSGTRKSGWWNKTFDSTTLRDARYNLSVNATDSAATPNTNISLNVSITIDNTKANVTAVSPANDTSFTDQTILINASVNDSLTGVFNATFRLTTSSGSTLTAWQYATMGTGNIGQGYWNASVDSKTLNNGKYNITINATDFAGTQQIVNISGIVIADQQNLVTGCQNLNEASGSYLLANNVFTWRNCFNVTADNVTLDCSGYTVEYANASSGYGVNITGFNSTVVKNCVFLQQNRSVQFNTAAIFALKSNNSIFINNSINSSGNYTYGIDLRQANFTNISSNRINVSGNFSYGMGLGLSGLNNITSNNISTRGGNDGYGINLTGSPYNSILNNNVTTGGAGTFSNYGIYLTSTVSGNVISGNTINTNGTSTNYGIYLTSSANNNTLTNNTIRTGGSGANNYGIYLLTTVSGNVVSGNTITTNGTFTNYGIYLTGSVDNNTLANNTIRTDGSSSDNYGIYLYNSISGNVVSGNTINTNGTASNFGISLVTSANNNTVANNTIRTGGSGANNYGIYLSSTVSGNVISGNTINTNGTGTNYGIYLTSSANNNTLTNNTIRTDGRSLSNFGIYLLTTVSGNVVSGNTITTNGTSQSYGIYLFTSANNNTVANNTIRTGGNAQSNIGIYLSSTVSGNVVSGNTINTNGTSYNFGIYLITSANNNTLANNTITTGGSSSDNIGISLTSTASGNVISGNTITTNGTRGNYGIDLDTSANNNTVAQNMITTNGTGSFGIHILRSNNSVFANNTVKVFGSGFGVQIENINLDVPTGNVFYNNIFNTTNRSINVTSNLSVNNFSITTYSGTNIVGGSLIGGNWYDNSTVGGLAAYSLTCTDANADGICDVQLDHANGGTNDTDFYPLTIAAAPDTTPPNNSIIVPLQNSNFSGNFVINASVNDSQSDVFQVNLTVYNNTGNATGLVQMNISSGTFKSGWWNKTFDSTTLRDARYNLSVNATDSAATPNTNISLNVSITIDNTKPNATAVVPFNNTNTSSTALLINASVNDSLTGVFNATFRLTTSSGSTLTAWQYATNNTIRTLTQSYWNATFDTSTVADGKYNITINATDYANSQQLLNISTITIDNTKPNATTLLPANQSNLSSTITVRAGANDSLTGIVSVNFQFRNSTNQTSRELMSLDTGTIYEGEWTATYNTAQLADGKYNITFNATDFTGNSNVTDTGNYQNFTVTIDNTAPNGTIIAPLNNTVINGSFIINASVNDSLSKVFNVTFRLRRPGSDSSAINSTVATGNFDQGYWSSTVNSSSFVNGIYNITLNATDFSGNVLLINSSTITINNTGLLNITLNGPLNLSINVGQNRTFTANATITCRNGLCQQVNATVYYNLTSISPSTRLNATAKEIPLHNVTTFVNQTCGWMDIDAACSLNWTINATGPIGSSYYLSINFTSNNSEIQQNGTSNFQVNITEPVATNTAPVVWNVTNGTVTLVDGSTSEFTVNFNATDTDGSSDLNSATAKVNITLNGLQRYNDSGNCESSDSDDNTKRYSCRVVFYYYDNASSIWTINASIQDNSAALGWNDTYSEGRRDNGASQNVTVNSLSAFSMVSSSIAATTSTNSQNVEMTFTINNTGNFDFTLVNLTPTDLNASLTDIFRLEGNFSVNATASTSDGFGTGILNGTPTNFSESNYPNSATLPHKITPDQAGQTRESDNKANRTLYIYIDIPQNKGLSTGVTYNASPSYPWQVILGTPS